MLRMESGHVEPKSGVSVCFPRLLLIKLDHTVDQTSALFSRHLALVGTQMVTKEIESLFYPADIGLTMRVSDEMFWSGPACVSFYVCP